VVVAYDSPHKQPEGAEALRDAPGHVEQIGRTPTRGDVWGPVGRAVRGTIDYARYLHPRFADATYLRDRMRKALPPVAAFLGRRTTASAEATATLVRRLIWLECAIPSSPKIARYLQSIAPDVVVVSPLVMDRCPQVDFIKSAKALGIRNALCVASWDHLTTKGLMRIEPDLVAVWNEGQKAEAMEYHGTSPDRIAVTGAQNFDRWFDRRPGRDREAFCRHVGLRSDRPFVLFVGSTASISAPEAEEDFVRRWTHAVRQALAARGREVGVLIRPHPYNSAHWTEIDLSDLDNVAVYPRGGANPVNEQDRADYFDSLYHSAAVVGVNTSAMIEAAIVGRTVHTILAPEFTETQGGTLHFRYLLPDKGGFLRVAPDLDTHVTQLEETLAAPDGNREAIEQFVRAFIRPRGLGVPATPVLVEALEALGARGHSQPERMPLKYYPLRALLWIGGAIALYGRDPSRLRNAMRKALSIRRKRVTRYLKNRRAARRKARAPRPTNARS
jgi:hypothetical protein